MYLGKVMEIAPADQIFEDARHPYTRALLSAIPIPDPKVKRERIILEGTIPSPQNPPTGCRFHNRCPAAKDICARECPDLVPVGEGHSAACHFCQ